MTVNRFDFGQISEVRETPGGGRCIPAALTRVGVFPYRRADGSIRRELRHPDEVFNTDSLQALAQAPVTDLHPPDMVTADNWKDFAVGHVGETVRHDGRLVQASLAVQDAKAIKKIDAGERKEISCGYTCDLEHTPGTWNGERYDAVQRNITYNHAAIGPEKWGRAGSDVSLRLDSEDATCHFDDNPTPEKEKPMKMVKIDGIDIEEGSATHIQALEKQRDAAIKRADSAEAKISDAIKAEENIKGELEAEKKRADAAEASLEAASAPEKISALVKARTELIGKARKLDSDSDFDAMSEREIMVSALKKHDSDFDDTDRSDDFVAGMFGVAVKSSEKKVDATHSTSTGSLQVATKTATKKDAADKVDPREKHRKDSADAWQKPLAFSKDAPAS